MATEMYFDRQGTLTIKIENETLCIPAAIALEVHIFLLQHERELNGWVRQQTKEGGYSFLAARTQKDPLIS